jgi:hypothetical protein
VLFNWRCLDLACGMTPLRPDGHRCLRSICGRRDGLGSDVISRRFGHASGQPQETKRCSVLRLKSQPRRTACDGKPLQHRTASDESLRCNISHSKATLEEAKAQFQKSWDAWKAWAKLEEVDCDAAN